jgi:Outer membrane receptor for ferrienterochelin and colicins
MGSSWNGTRRTILRIGSIFCGLLVIPGRAPLLAQGSTTSSLQGTIHFAEAADATRDAVVNVLNVSTGYALRVRTRTGHFFVQGLLPGGPYRIVVTALGYSPQILSGIYLTLGEQRNSEITLFPVEGALDTIRITAARRSDTYLGGGPGTLISDSVLRRLPTADRDLYDFIRLVPQVGTHFGMSGAGASFRFNSYLIDGVSDRQLQGNNVLGGSAIGGKSISLEAIKEYEVLLAPYDARFGNFAGMLVNAVTKNGTNDMHGSTYGYFRNADLARTSSFIGSSPFERKQFGMSLGGPIVRDRLHFFIATEFQQSAAPASGTYVGQDAGVSPALNVRESDVTRFASLLRARGIDAGDGGRVTSLNPAVTSFERLDLSLPRWKSRVVVRDDYSSVKLTRFNRDLLNFPLTSNAWINTTEKHATAIQLITQTSAAASNELTVAHMDRPGIAEGYAASPSVQVQVRSPDGLTAVQLLAGPPAIAGGAGSSQIISELGDHLSVQAGTRHTLGVGAHVEVFKFHATSVKGGLGAWKFGSLDGLANGDANSYVIVKDFGTALKSVRGEEPSAYATDEWRVSDRMSVNVGVRADALNFSSRGTFNPTVDSIFQRKTDDYPQTRVAWSPRLGFGWRPSAHGKTSIAGGAGIFVGPPPLGWLLGPLRSNGAGVRTLTCAGIAGSGRIPKFISDVNAQPQACPNGVGYSDGPVALVDKNLTMAKSFRTSLSLERRIPLRIDAGAEALYSRVLTDFMFVNDALAGPQGLDSHGRVMYGTIDSTRKSHPVYVSGRFPEVIDLRNHSIGHSWSVTTRLNRDFVDRYELHASYTYSRVRDLQSLTNVSAVSPLDIWSGGRFTAGRHDDMSAGVSSFDIPHRVVLAATYNAPWKKWSTDISLYYVGESGTPFTYKDSTSGGFGDLNADGTAANDPIYVPRSTHDPAEILFLGDSAGTQAAGFEKFIHDTPCLRRQRGRIVARNSCRGAWFSTSNASLRQSLPSFDGHSLSLQAEVFNLLNLLRPSWGLYKIPNDKILQHAGQISANGQAVFVFDEAQAKMSIPNIESGYQIQLSLRYSF